MTTTVVLDRDGVEMGRWAIAQPVDLALVDQLARWQLAAARMGWRIALVDTSADLRGLLDLVGLSVEVGGEPEDVEEAGVEEAVVPHHPIS